MVTEIMPEDPISQDGILYYDLALSLYPDEPSEAVRTRRLQALMRRRGISSRGPFIDAAGRAVRWFTAEQAAELRRAGRPGRPPKREN